MLRSFYTSMVDVTVKNPDTIKPFGGDELCNSVAMVTNFKVDIGL